MLTVVRRKIKTGSGAVHLIKAKIPSVIMDDTAVEDIWRYSAKRITKYNPAFRDSSGSYLKDEWTEFVQIGKTFAGEVFTLDAYLPVEAKYIAAAQEFFDLQCCGGIIVKNLERRAFEHYRYADRGELKRLNKSLAEGSIVPRKDLDTLIKLILRQIIWAELYCTHDADHVLRFGYDFYMYVNSNMNMDEFFKKVEESGLYVD